MYAHTTGDLFCVMNVQELRPVQENKQVQEINKTVNSC